MKITSKEQAASEGVEFLWIGFEAGLVASWTAIVDGREYTLQREPEPVVMFTEFELNQHMMRLAKTSGIPAGAAVEFCNLILARHTEILRAMGNEELVAKVRNGAEIVYDQLTMSGARGLIALITEHIDANRPELTDAVIDDWDLEWHGFGASEPGSLPYFIARRAAEYRSPAVAKLRAENERLKKDREEGNADYLKLRDISDGHEVAYHKCMRLLESAPKPQPVDDSDEWGTYAHGNSVVICHHLPGGQWFAKHIVAGLFSPGTPLDPTRIFKVTSQPRGPLNVPSDGDSDASKEAELKEVVQVFFDLRNQLRNVFTYGKGHTEKACTDVEDLLQRNTWPAIKKANEVKL